MKFKKEIFVALMILALFLAGCVAPGPEQNPKADDSGATVEGVNELVRGNNQFAFEIYNELKKDGENLFLSPWSISTALGMTYEGAKGKTAEEMQSVLHLPKDDNVRKFSFASMYNTMNTGEKPYKLSTANALWAEKSYSFKSDYIETVQKYYAGKATNLDFSNDAEGSRKTINAWVEEQTNNKIKDLIPQGLINELTRLVLTNAIYFKGSWALRFEEKNTKPEDFKVSQEKIVKAQMMSLTGKDAEFNYAETDDLHVLEMPYKGEELSMIILLPKEGSLTAIEGSVNAETLNELESKMTKKRVDVYFPKFTFETKYLIAENLKKMGMPTAFAGGEADFSGMDGTRDLYISNVIHQAFIKVDEEGTEAAAATAVIIQKTSACPSQIPVFRADHPFIFIIQEKKTGSILFLGKVEDPTK